MPDPRGAQAPPAAPIPKSLTVGERLVRRGAITREQLEEALEAQTIFGGRLGTNLLELGYIDECTLNEVLAEKFAVNPIQGEIADAQPDPQALALVPPGIAEKYRLVPLRREGRRLHVLMLDPSNLAVIDEISFLTGHMIKPCVAAEARILYLLEKFYGIRRETRYLIFKGGDSMRKASAEPSWEAAAASEAMRMNWVQEEEGGSYEVSAPEEPPAEEELMPEDLHEKMMAKVASHAVDAAPQVCVSDVQIARNPDAARPAPRPIGGKLGKRIEEAGARLVGEGTHVGPASPPAQKTAGPEAVSPLTMQEAVARLAAVESRDEVARILMAFAKTCCRRAALFIVRGGAILGWDAMGEGVNADAVREMQFPADGLTFFHKAIEAKVPVISNLQADAGQAPLAGLLAALGGGAPRNALTVPILIRGRVVNLFYADHGPGEPVPEGVGEYLTVFGHVPQAFEALLRKRKAMVSQE